MQITTNSLPCSAKKRAEGSTIMWTVGLLVHHMFRIIINILFVQKMYNNTQSKIKKKIK